MITFDTVDGELHVRFTGNNFRYSIRSNRGVHIDGFVKINTPHYETSLNVTDGELLVAMMFIDERTEICKFFTVHNPESWVEDLVLASKTLED
jgi:hypothetical protein